MTAIATEHWLGIVDTLPKKRVRQPRSRYVQRSVDCDDPHDSTSHATETINTFGLLPRFDIPVWVNFSDRLATFYVIENELYEPLLSIFSIIQTAFKGICKANVSLITKTDEYDRDYLVISITGTKSQNENMAKYLMQCNYQMAHTLPVNVLPLVVLTMGQNESF